MVATSTYLQGFIRLDISSWMTNIKSFLFNFYELIVAIGFVAAYSLINDYQADQRVGLVHEPIVNDFYLVDYHRIDPTSDPRYRYFPLRIMSIDGDQIRFKVGNIGHTQKVSVTKHVKFDSALHRNFYRVDNLVVSKQQLVYLAETGVVYDIARPQNIFIDGWIVMELNELVVD